MDIEGAELSAIGQASDGVLLSISQITVEFHGFLYPETEEQISKTKERLQSLGFTAIDFSRWRNGDVLFLNPNLNVGLWDLARLWSYKYGTGAWRMLKRWLR